MIITALEKAFRFVQKGGLGLSKKCLWLTMIVAKINKTTRHIDNLLNAVGTGYFDLLFYHYPLKIFDTENDAENSWRLFCEISIYEIRHIGVSNSCVPHLKRLLKFCNSKCLQKPFANEILINPYTYGRNLDIIR